MRTPLLIAAVALTGCAVIDGINHDAREREEQRTQRAAYNEKMRVAWEESEKWEEWQLDEIQQELRFHFRNDINCYVNHFYEDFTPKTFVAAVKDADARLGRKFKGTGPHLAADLNAIMRTPGEPLAALRASCRKERCAAVEESKKNFKPGGVILVSDGCE